jgi:hypothetical protein
LRLDRVVAVPLQRLDQLALVLNMHLPFDNVPRGIVQVLVKRRAIHPPPPG